MAKKDGSTSRSLSAPFRPTIALPSSSFVDSLFTDASPGPMTLVSNFFSENDPDSECRSFSQLLAGAMASPKAVTAHRQRFLAAGDSSSKERVSGEGGSDADFLLKQNHPSGGSDADFRLKQNQPSGLMIAQPPMFTIPPGLSPASLLDSPSFFSSGQGPFGMSHQQALAQFTAQAAQAHSQSHIQAEFPSTLSAAPAASLPQLPSFNSHTITCQQIPPMKKESSDLSHSDQRSQPSSFIVDKPPDDDYNWRKYGQKHVKGSEFPRSYYKCTHPNCPVKKKVERSLDGQVTEITYKGQHNHPPPQPNKRAKDTGNSNGNLSLQGSSELALEGQTGNLNKSKEGVPLKDQESSQATPENLSGSSDSEEVGDVETRVDERDEDEPEPKRRNTEVRVSEPALSHRTVTEPRIIVQTTSEVDLLDDGYRWRKYGQKVVKGNPYPRSYYKCTNPGCNVRKHVERAASDPKAVITTYEGKHNHDVPAAKNSSHNTANNNASQLKSHNAVADKHTSIRQEDFENRDPQPIAVLRFKEERIT